MAMRIIVKKHLAPNGKAICNTGTRETVATWEAFEALGRHERCGNCRNKYLRNNRIVTGKRIR